MRVVDELVLTLSQVPTDHLLLLVALGAFGLAAFAIHAVLSMAKRNGRR
jgi:hypothetical protein